MMYDNVKLNEYGCYSLKNCRVTKKEKITTKKNIIRKPRAVAKLVTRMKNFAF